MASSMNGEEPCLGVSGESAGVDLINNLNNDCLRRIFLNLPPGDKLNAEKVCKRWRGVAKVAWNTVKYLDFTKSTTNTTDFDTLPANYKNIQCIAKIILRCGRYLDGLKLGTICHYSMLPFVIQHCTNLARLEISPYPINDTDVVIPKMRGLRYFRLDCSSTDSIGGILQSLSYETLNEFHLQAGERLDEVSRAHLPDNFYHYLRDLKNLTVMSLHYFHLTSNAVKIISQNFNLTSLSLANCVMSGNLSLNSLRNVEYLNLECMFNVEDSFIMELSDTCKKLKYLNINRCYRITDLGIMTLLELPELQDLSLNRILSITDFPLSGLYNIRRLSCENCENVGNDEVINLIKFAPNLEYLNLGWTSVTHKVLVEANEVSKRRTNGVSLRLVIDKSVIEAWNEKRDSPLLIVESTDDTTNPHTSPQWVRHGDDNNDDFFDDNYGFQYDYSSESEAEIDVSVADN